MKRHEGAHGSPAAPTTVLSIPAMKTPLWNEEKEGTFVLFFFFKGDFPWQATNRLQRKEQWP